MRASTAFFAGVGTVVVAIAAVGWGTWPLLLRWSERGGTLAVQLIADHHYFRLLESLTESFKLRRGLMHLPHAQYELSQTVLSERPTLAL